MSRIIKGYAAENIAAEPFHISPLPGSVKNDEEAGKKNVGGDKVAIEKEAYEKGFRAGERAGFELGKQKAEVMFNGIGRVLDELSSFKKSLYGSCEAEILDLVLAIARKVVQVETETKKEAVLGCVRTALKAVVAAGDIVIKVNPKDLEIIHQYRKELSRYGDGVKGLKIEGDEAISKGGCIIETNYGEVDATVNAILSELEENLRNAG